MSLQGQWGKRGRPPKSAYRDGLIVVQKSYLGIKETLSRSIYSHEVKCRRCGASRWVKPQDVHQVRHCKPCTRHLRLKKRRRKINDR